MTLLNLYYLIVGLISKYSPTEGWLWYLNGGKTIQSITLAHSGFLIFEELDCFLYILFHVIRSALFLNALLLFRSLYRLIQGFFLLYNVIELLKN